MYFFSDNMLHKLAANVVRLRFGFGQVVYGDFFFYQKQLPAVSEDDFDDRLHKNS